MNRLYIIEINIAIKYKQSVYNRDKYCNETYKHTNKKNKNACNVTTICTLCILFVY